MKAIQRILLATDFSSTANNALIYALELAREIQAALIILNAYQIPAPDYNAYTVSYHKELYPEQYLRNAERNMETLKHDFLYAPKVAYECINQPGLAADVIRNIANEKNADLIIMGTRKAEGAKAWFGSVTTATVRHSDCPVLVIPEKARFARPRRIVLTTYQIQVQHIELLGVLKSLMDLFGAGLEVLHVHAKEEKPPKEHARLKEALDDFFGKPIRFAYEEGEPVNEGIQRHLDYSGADMLAMLPLKHGLLDQLIHSSQTRYMIFHTDIPLLALR
jgi:nucleotide-binding universal stress UspA family protein